jgi:hypothetical protein
VLMTNLFLRNGERTPDQKIDNAKSAAALRNATINNPRTHLRRYWSRLR